MGEWSDFDMDTAPAGGGGDPFADAASDYDPADTAATGALPGGTDGQLTPFSPKGGFDITDVLGGKFQNVNARADQGGGFWSGVGSALRTGVSAYLDYTGRPASALKRMLDGTVPNPGGGGSAPGLLPGEMGGHGAAGQVQAILHGIRLRTGGTLDSNGHVHGGMRVTQRSIVNLIVRYGFNPVAAMTGAPPQALLFLFMREKGTTHHRRGPGLYTIARKMRKYAALQATCSRILGRGGHRRRHYHHRPKYNFHKRRKR